MYFPYHLSITKIVYEAKDIKTFYFSHKLNSQPGQFVMLWVPGIDQKPFSIAYDDGQKFGLTIFKRGPLTEKLFAMRVGDRIGITGPYGTAFTIKPNTHYIMVAGGYGTAPLGYLAEKLVSPPPYNGGQVGVEINIDFLIGARSAKHLLFEQRLTKIPNLKLHIATDDGSKGYRGYVTDLLSKLIGEISDKRLVVTCGPELMERKVLDICNQYNIECEISIERYMKCGYGVCGQCAVDPIGICMCTHGPVVNRELANQLTEFGKYHRDKSGQIINF